MDNLTHKKILKALDVTEFLTIRHVARLFYGVTRKGEKAKAGTARPYKTSKREYRLEPGYWSAKHALNSLLKKTVLVRGKERPLLEARISDNESREVIYHRPDAQHIRRSDDLMYGHDMAIVVSYVLLQASGELYAFSRFWDADQKEYYGRQWDLWPDAVFALLRNPEHMFFLEVDGGTEWDKGQFREKCETYVRYANAHPDQRLTVLFPARGYDEPDERRVEKMLAVFAGLRRQNMFLATTWAQFMGDLKLMDGTPLGPVFKSPWPNPPNPLDPSAISLFDVI